MNGNSSIPDFRDILKAFQVYRNNSLDFISSAALRSLPHCTNFNVLSKNVVCRDYPAVSSFYTAQKRRIKQPSIIISSFNDPIKQHKRTTYDLDMTVLYHSQGRFNFYDNSWKEKLNALKPSGLLNLIMGSPIENVPVMSVSKGDIYVELGQYLMQLSNNYYRETFFEIADVIGFLREDLNSQRLSSHINILSTEDMGSQSLDGPSHNLRFKLGGVSFCEAYIFCLKTMENSLDVLFIGNVDFLLPFLKSIWTGHHLKPLTDEFRQSIITVKSKNKQLFIPTLLIGHNSIPFPVEGDSALNEELHQLDKGNIFVTMKHEKPSQIVEYLLKDSHFLSLMTIDDVIKEPLPSMIEQMSQLGIRYVYYSPYNYRHSRKLAAKMGLDTGWNTAISLSDNCEDERLEWESFAQLPHGIEQIKQHLLTQDNVPLLVHIFTHATEKSILGMMDVMTQWGEGVSSICNSSYAGIADVYKKSRLLVSMNQFEPFYFTGSDLYSSELDQSEEMLNSGLKGGHERHRFYTSFNQNKHIFHINELINSTYATLHIDNRTDLSIFPAFFNECKIRDNNVDNMLMVGISIIYTVNICMLFDWLVNFPPILGSGWLYFFLFLAIPIFSLNLFTAEPEVSDSRLFELLPWKPLNFGETPSIPRPFWVRHVCRLVLTSIVLIVINWITWFDQLRNTDLFGNITIIGVLFNRELKRWLDEESDQVASIRNISDFFMAIVLQIFTFVICVSLLNRNSSFLRNFHQPKCRSLTITFILILLTSWIVGECRCFLLFRRLMISSVDWWLWILVFVLIGCVLVVDSILLRAENRVTKETNQIYRWNFDTRLGMWSPA